MAQSFRDKEPLLPAVARGDAEAVATCIDRYGALVWSLARRMSRDASQMEDIVQEIFIEVWRCAERYDPEVGSETTFIATIARRRLIDAGRRSSRRPEVETLETDVFAETDEMLDRLEIADEAQLAARAIDQLKPEQRQVLLLSIRDGLTHSQIASATSIPLGTVKSHIRRGLERVTLSLKAPSSGKIEEALS